MHAPAPFSSGWPLWVDVPRQSGNLLPIEINMNTHSFLTRFCHSPIPRRAAGLLVVLAWSNLAFCGEIHSAASSGDLEKVGALLRINPAWVFSKDKTGATPLRYAAAEGHNAVAALLLANKAEVNARNDEGQTPLHYAANYGHKEMVALLLANKAAVNARNLVGNAPLHLAAEKGHKEVAVLLLASNAEVMPGITTARRRCTTRRIMVTKRWRHCCWPIRLRLMPRTSLVIRLCA